MLKNFLLVAWRNLWRKKGFSFLNITGLAIGMAAATLILLWIQSEMRRDHNFAKTDRIYEVWNSYNDKGHINSWSTTPKVMAGAIKADYPEVEHVVRVNWNFALLFSVGETKLKPMGNAVDSNFFEVFDHEFVQGNPSTALSTPESVVLTESLAKSLFGDKEAMGQVITVDNVDEMVVRAVVKDPSPNSRFRFKYLVNWAYLRKKGGDDSNWQNNSTKNFVLLQEGSSLDAFNNKIKDLRKKYDEGSPTMVTFLYPFSQSYLYGRIENGKVAGGRIEIVRLFGWIAAFILLVACINFMNLSTARSEKRAREVGIRKVVGARKASLIVQFMGESMLLCTIASVFALLLVQLTLPAYNRLVDRQLEIEWSDWHFWAYGGLFVLITGVLAGSYPAIFLSSFRPVRVLKGTVKAANALVTPRKMLVVGQFTFAIVLIIATIVVREQMRMAQDRQSGYGRDHLVYHFIEGDIEKNYEKIRLDLLASGVVESVTKTSSPFTDSYSNTWGIGWRGKQPDDRRLVNQMCADDAVVKTAQLKILEGRDFDLSQYPTDSNAVIVNEAAVKLMGFEEPIGEILKAMDDEFHIVGVVQDFVMESPYEPVSPTVIYGAKGWFNVVNMRLNAQVSTKTAIDKMETIFKKYNPSFPFEYIFVDQQYAEKFENEKRSSTLATLFAVLTIFISCLGLFGLAAYMAENRIKEIGVRKVLGGSVTDITRLLSVDFIKLVLLAFIIAAPLGYWAMHSWLKDFTYRISLEWWIFLYAGLAAILIALLTVSSQAIRAARSNPVKSLRSE